MMKDKKRRKGPLLDEDQIERNALLSLPVSFVIFGKPGCGKTALAELISSTWKCVHINDTVILEETCKMDTEIGKKANEILCSGDELADDFVFHLLCEKLKSPSVQHYGYVLDCLPATATKTIVEEKLKFLKDINPVVVINLKISDQDLAKHRDDQRVEMSTSVLRTSFITSSDTETTASNTISTTEMYDEDKDKEKPDEIDLYDEELKDISVPQVSMNPSESWVKRTQDTIENIQNELCFYNNHVLLPVENFIVNHNRQHLIEMDGNLPTKELFKSVLKALDIRGLCRAPVPKRLFITEDDDDVGTDGLDNDDFLKQLCETSNILPKFRWRRSKWGRYCPVKLVEGNLVLGKMEFSVGFMDKMYCLSSMDAMEKFIFNPRPYLLPPYPLIPCKICIVGPPTSGRTTLAKAIAQHFDAMVLDIEELITPYMALEIKKACEVAKEEAETSAMNQLAIEQAKSPVQLEITPDHPDVVRAVNDAVKFAHGTVVATEAMYVDAIRSGIAVAEERKAKQAGKKPVFGGWIIDGFPKTRDHWAALVENDILPDALIILDDHEAPENYLFSRFTRSHTLSGSSDGTKTESELATKVSDLLIKWQKTKAEHDRHMEQLIATAKGSAIDPLIINCSFSEQKIATEAISYLEGIFTIKPYEFTFADEDADADDDPVLESADNNEGDEENGESEDMSRKAKPWGDTKHFCPVALKELDVLWPGSDDYCLKYNEKLYCFSNEEAKEKFTNKPEDFIVSSHLLKPPPIRIFILGPKNSGKTTIGRRFAEKYNLFHISFKEYLQEEILSKMVKPPLVDDDEWEGEIPLIEEEEDPENKEDLTDDEVEIKAYLAHGDSPSDELLKKFTETFWFNEPYRSSGFVLEGFPSKPEEMHFLAGCGLYPDAVLILEIEEDCVIKRTLPRRLSLWKKKRSERLFKRKQNREKIIAEWEKDKDQRRTEVKDELSERIAAVTRNSSSDEDDEEEDEVEQLKEELQERLAEIDEEEPPEIEEEEEEEDENEATDRMKSSMSEQYQECVEQISQIQEVCSELKLPTHVVNGSKKEEVVTFSVNKTLLQYSDNRQSIFLKCTPVDVKMAKELLDRGYKLLSNFLKWCPVKTSQSKYNILPPMLWRESDQYPVIFRQHLYYMSSASNREMFIANPLKYLSQNPPGPPYPVTLSIVGPPKSGKTTVANRFCQEYGCVRLSVGEVLRRQISLFPFSTLSEIIKSHLKAGGTIPEDVCALALESALLDIQCATRGYVLDGWPITKAQADKITNCHIIPVCVLELDVNSDEALRRAKNDRNSLDRLDPVHDSDLIITERSKEYYDSIIPVKKLYSLEHDNWYKIGGDHSVWWVWNQCNERALYTAKQIQQYISRTNSGQVAPIHGLCVTPSEFEKGIGEFSKYCPVDLVLHGELVDCSEKSLEFAVEYRQKYYKMCCEEDLQSFSANPDSFVSPSVPKTVPSVLPIKKSQSDVKKLFPKQMEINGFCSVCYSDGNQRYESLKPGFSDFIAEYNSKLFSFCNHKHLECFMRKPAHYATVTLPSKLPPLREPTPLDSLPILGFLEQNVASSIIEAMSAVGLFKPKYPFWSSTSSALYFLALHLKAFNLKSDDFVHQTFKQKLNEFKAKCKLIKYLGSEMNYGYQEPKERHISFDHKMDVFVNLKTGAV